MLMSVRCLMYFSSDRTEVSLCSSSLSSSSTLRLRAEVVSFGFDFEELLAVVSAFGLVEGAAAVFLDRADSRVDVTGGVGLVALEGI